MDRHEASGLDVVTTVTTPEHVQFEFRLAGTARRFAAFVVDVAIRAVIFVLLMLGITCSGILVNLAVSEYLIDIVGMISYFLFTWAYGIFFEYWMNGQTPGKKVMSIRAVMTDGQSITVPAIIIRNLLRTADIFPLLAIQVGDEPSQSIVVPLFLFSLLIMSLTAKMQRLGDIAASTMVITEDPEYTSARFADIHDPQMQALAEDLPPDLLPSPALIQAISLYIDRRSFLTAAHREELCQLVTDSLRERYQLSKEVTNDQLLCAIHYKEFHMADRIFDLDDEQHPKSSEPARGIVYANR